MPAASRNLRSAHACAALLIVSLAAWQPALSLQPQAVPMATDARHDDAKKDDPQKDDPREIVRRSVEIDRRNFELARGYTWQHRLVVKSLDKDGKVKHQDIETFDINYFYGRQYARLVREDDKPLDAKKEKKQEEEQDKFISKLKNESEEDRRKRLEKEEKRRRE